MRGKVRRFKELSPSGGKNIYKQRVGDLWFFIMFTIFISGELLHLFAREDAGDGWKTENTEREKNVREWFLRMENKSNGR